MNVYHCYHAHPRLPGQPCNAKIEAFFFGPEVLLRCWRCHKPVRFTVAKKAEPVLEYA